MLSDRILSVCAISVSFIALLVSIWQGFVVREHNKLSVKPNMLIAPGLEGEGGKNGIYISNAGLGPGIVRNAKLVVNNNEFDFTINSWSDVLNVIDVDPLCFATSWLPVGSAIKASEEIPLIKISKSAAVGCYSETIKLLTSSLIVEIDYESIYGDSYMISKLAVFEKDDFKSVSLLE